MVHKIIAELLDEMGLENKTVGVAPSVVYEYHGDVLAAVRRMDGFGSADGCEVAVALIGEHQVLRIQAAGGGGNGGGAAAGWALKEHFPELA